MRHLRFLTGKSVQGCHQAQIIVLGAIGKAINSDMLKTAATAGRITADQWSDWAKGTGKNPMSKDMIDRTQPAIFRAIQRGMVKDFHKLSDFCCEAAEVLLGAADFLTDDDEVKEEEEDLYPHLTKLADEKDDEVDTTEPCNDFDSGADTNPMFNRGNIH